MSTSSTPLARPDICSMAAVPNHEPPVSPSVEHLRSSPPVGGSAGVGDVCTIAEHLRMVYAQCPGNIPLTVLPSGYTTFVPAADYRRGAERVAQMAATCNVYAMATTVRSVPRQGRGRSADALAMPAVVLDVDCAGLGHADVAGRLPLPSRSDALRLLMALPVRPSIVVDSGHGYWVWWLLQDPMVMANDDERRAGATLAAGWNRMAREQWRSEGFHLDNAGDLARLTRVAGTWNRKVDPAVPVRLIEADPRRRYCTQDLARWLPEPQSPQRPRSAPGRPATRFRELSPIEAFSRVVSWADVLECVGFGVLREFDEVTFWSHPAQTSGDGTPAATTNAHGVPVLVVFSESTAAATGLPAGSGHRLTRFRTWAVLHYGGDEAAAARALRAMRAGAR